VGWRKLSPPDENGLMVEPDNPEEFAKGLSRYLESAELTAKIAAAGKNHAENMFSLEKMLDRYKSEYRRLMQ
jgi:glycosyltransferase involved in cell wall biosynthesis